MLQAFLEVLQHCKILSDICDLTTSKLAVSAYFDDVSSVRARILGRDAICVDGVCMHRWYAYHALYKVGSVSLLLLCLLACK